MSAETALRKELTKLINGRRYRFELTKEWGCEAVCGSVGAVWEESCTLLNPIFLGDFPCAESSVMIPFSSIVQASELLQ